MTENAHPGADAAAFVPTDDTFAIRKEAASHLLGFLDRTAAMVARCDAVMRDKRADQFAAANAATRLMKVSTDITKALMIATFGETRHRTIREQVAPPPQSKAQDQIEHELDATTAALAGELRALTEECTAEWREDREKHLKWKADAERYRQPQEQWSSLPETSDDPPSP